MVLILHYSIFVMLYNISKDIFNWRENERENASMNSHVSDLNMNN